MRVTAVLLCFDMVAERVSSKQISAMAEVPLRTKNIDFDRFGPGTGPNGQATFPVDPQPPSPSAVPLVLSGLNLEN